MNKRNNIIKRKHSIGICLGIIAALVIFVSETLYYNYVASEKTCIKTDADPDDGNADHFILTINKDAVASVAQMTINQALHFISEIYLDDSDIAEIVVDQKLDFNTYFKSLFRLIISPNAP